MLIVEGKQNLCQEKQKNLEAATQSSRAETGRFWRPGPGPAGVHEQNSFELEFSFLLPTYGDIAEPLKSTSRCARVIDGLGMAPVCAAPVWRHRTRISAVAAAESSEAITSGKCRFVISQLVRE